MSSRTRSISSCAPRRTLVKSERASRLWRSCSQLRRMRCAALASGVPGVLRWVSTCADIRIDATEVRSSWLRTPRKSECGCDSGRREGRGELGQAAIHRLIEVDQVVEVVGARRRVLAAPQANHRRAQQRVVVDELARVRMRRGGPVAARPALERRGRRDRRRRVGGGLDPLHVLRDRLQHLAEVDPAHRRLGGAARRPRALVLPFAQDVVEALVDEVRQAHGGG